MAATPTPNPPNPFTAWMPWADLGWRAFDNLLSTGQDLGEQADRITRAGQAAPAAAGKAAGAPPMLPMLSAWGEWQGAALQWMTEAWSQWFGLWAGFNPMAVRGEGGPGSALQAAPMALPAAFVAAERSPAAEPAQAARAGRRSAERASADLEHAFASSSARRGGRAKTKPRAARKSSRGT